jgi:hypothetical protein
MRVFFYLAVVGLCLSVTAHIATFFGVDPQQTFPSVWLLHDGIFVIWLPAIIFTNRRSKEGSKSNPWATILAGTPPWMGAMIGPLLAYAGFNFFFTIFVLLGGHSPTSENGTFALKDHSRVIRTLTEAEYHRYRAYEARVSSGHSIVFYLMGMTMLYPRAVNQDDLRTQTTGFG